MCPKFDLVIANFFYLLLNFTEQAFKFFDIGKLIIYANILLAFGLYVQFYHILIPINRELLVNIWSFLLSKL